MTLLVTLAVLTVQALVSPSSAAIINGFPGPTVNTKNGTYGGVHLPAYNQDLFLGVRYAQVSTCVPTDHVHFLNHTRSLFVSGEQSISTQHGRASSP